MAARLLAALACLGALAVACVQDDGSRFNPIGDLTSTSEDEERELGLEFDKALQESVRVIQDPVVAGFINDLGQEIVRQIEPQPFIYRFRVIDDPALNAFAVPGGYVYFHSGTLLAAGSIDELAAVMGHEIAHVKGHHYARMKAKSQIPDLLVGAAGLAAAVATKQPGVLLATQAANVAVKLKFSREFENEADDLGAVFVTRSGYDPAGSARFFERILAEREETPYEIPPYLFSHPDVEERIESVRRRAETLRPTRAPDPRLEQGLRDAQARLEYLLATGRDTVPPPQPRSGARRADALLVEADRLAQEGDRDQALLRLARAEAADPTDPRVPYQIADLLGAAGRSREAAAAYRRTVALDPTRALVFYKLGLALEEVGDRHAAVHAYEQASARAGANSSMRARADWKIETLIFPVLIDAGFATGDAGDSAPDSVTPLGAELDAYPAGAERFAWWGTLHGRYSAYPSELRVAWIDPAGATLAVTRVESFDGQWIGSRVELDAEPAPGTWTAEVRFQDNVLERRRFEVQRER